MIELLLPFPPTVNHMYRNNEKGGRQLTDKAKAFRFRVGMIVMTCGAAAGINQPVQVAYTFFPPDKRRRDAANLEKATSDALVHAGVLADDCLIRRMPIEFGPVTPGGATVVQLLTLDRQQLATREQQLLDYLAVLKANSTTVDLLLPN